MKGKIAMVLFIIYNLLIGFNGILLGIAIERNDLTLKEIIFDDTYTKEEMNELDDISIINDCKDLIGLEDITKCINNHIKKFYKYEVQETDKKMSFDRLKIKGGDCSDWSMLWESIISYTDLNYKPITFDVDDTVAHRISLIYNDEGYCIVDATTVDCSVYGYE